MPPRVDVTSRQLQQQSQTMTTGYQEFAAYQEVFERAIGQKFQTLRLRLVQLEEERDKLLQQNQLLTGVTWGDSFKMLQEFTHEGKVHGVAVNADSRFVAAASWNKTIGLYNIQSGTHATLGPQGSDGSTMDGLYSVAFAKRSGDYHLLAVGSKDACIYIWDYQQSNMLTKLGQPQDKDKAHKDEVNCVDFHSKQSVLASASDDNQAIIWDYDGGRALRNLHDHGHTEEVYGVAFLGRSDMFQYNVASCSNDKSTIIWDMRDRRVVQRLTGHNDDIIGIDFADYHGHGLLATGSDDGSIIVWDSRRWNQPLYHIDVVTAVLGAKQNKKDGAKGQQNVPEEEKPEVKRIAFSRDGNSLAGACENSVVVYQGFNSADVDVATPTIPQACHNDCCFDVAWGTDASTGQNILVSGGHDCRIQVLSL